MSLKILGFGDPHLKYPRGVDTAAELSQEQRQDLFRSEPLESWISGLEDEEKPDLIMTVGDIIDRVPSKRENKEETAKDIQLAKEVFLDEIERLCREYDIEGVGVGGNHDADIHSEMFSGYDHIHDLNFSTIEAEELGLEEDYTLAGTGATEFDIGPEIDYRSYESLRSGENFLEHTDDRRWENREFRGKYPNGSVPHLEVLENNLHHLAHVGNDTGVISDILGIEPDERQEFKQEVSNYIEKYEKMSNIIEEATSSTENGRVVYLNHNAPFNTSLDPRKEDSEIVYDGSICDKNMLSEYQPDLAVSGHTHNGGMDFIGETYGKEDPTTAVNLNAGNAVEIEVKDDGKISYRILN